MIPVGARRRTPVCPNCESNDNVSGFVRLDDSEQKDTDYTCSRCGWSKLVPNGPRGHVADEEEGSLLLDDVAVYGVAFVNDEGRRVHPTFVQVDEETGELDYTKAGTDGLAMRPAPIYFP